MGSRKEKGSGRAKDVRTLKRVTQAFRPYKGQIALVMLAIILASLLGLVDPFVLRAIFDDAIGKRNVPLLVVLVSIMVVLPMLLSLIGIGQDYLSNRIGQSVMRDFRRELYAHLQRM
jgi:ATP-binding cassette, subfamily B, bacterial